MRNAIAVTALVAAMFLVANSASSAPRTNADILVDLSSETLNVDGNEHAFVQRLVLTRGGWDVEFFVQPFIPNSQAEDGFVYFGITSNNPNAIIFATNSNMTRNLLMLPPGGGSGGADPWDDVDTSVVYARMRHKDSSSNAWDNVAYVHFNVYAPNQTTFTIHYKAGPIPTPPYSPTLYPGFAHIRATSLGN